MKKLVKEFRDFINRGNVLDLAIGVILATAFSAITSTLVNKVIMPAIGLIFGNKDFTNILNLTARPEITAVAEDGTVTVVQAAVVVAFGDLLAAVLNFFLIALICFIIVKSFNRAAKLATAKKKAEEEAAAKAAAEAKEPPKPTTEELLTQIRDLLEKRGN